MLYFKHKILIWLLLIISVLLLFSLFNVKLSRDKLLRQVQVPATPKPVPATPKPVPTTPKPVPTTPKPVPTTPKPVPTTPKPVPTTPKPVPTTPKPVPTTPKPTPAPIKTTEKRRRTPFDPDAKCTSTHKTKVKKSDVNTANLLSYSALTNKTLQKLIAERQHGNFMPVLNVQQKADYMYLYLVVRDAFISKKIEHFLVNGALLGIYRHGGLVPWDHDIDLGVNVKNWKDMHDALSCIEGFRLQWSDYKQYYHARFSVNGTSVPFVDFFIYGFDNDFVYGLDTVGDMKYAWRNVFPLQEMLVEGVPFFVPRNISALVKVEYTPHICELQAIHLPVDKSWAKGYKDAFSKKTIECSDLSYMYTLKN